MAKTPKTEWLGARVDESLSKLVAGYIEAAQMSMGELVRLAVTEYIKNHGVQSALESRLIKKEGTNV